MGLGEYQAQVRHVLCDPTPNEDDVRQLGSESWRWHTYRRLFRNRLIETLENCFGRLVEVIGAETFRGLVGGFLVDVSPRSPYLRDVPGEFLWWLESAWPRVRVDEALPPFALDLARFEWAELDTAYSSDADEPREIVELTMDLPAALAPAHRLLRLDHAVHRFVPGDSDTLPAGPLVLCLYRDPKTFDVRTLELTPVTASLLFEMAREVRPLAEVVRAVAERHGAIIDTVFLEALSAVLADLVARGVLLGSLDPPESRCHSTPSGL